MIPITLENFSGETQYCLGGFVAFPFLSLAILAAFELGLVPVLVEAK